VHNSVAPFTSHDKLHEFDARKPISRAKPAHFDIFAAKFSVRNVLRKVESSNTKYECTILQVDFNYEVRAYGEPCRNSQALLRVPEGGWK